MLVGMNWIFTHAAIFELRAFVCICFGFSSFWLGHTSDEHPKLSFPWGRRLVSFFSFSLADRKSVV